MSDTASRIRAIISDHLNVEGERVTDDAAFESLGADSLDSVELTMALEDEFKMEIGDADAEKYTLPEHKVGDLIGFIKQKTGESA